MNDASHKRRHQKAIKFLLVCIALAIVTTAIWSRWSEATDPRVSLGEWESSHIWWQRGKCQECHRDQEAHEADDPHIAGKMPASHRQPGWGHTHGRAEHSSEGRCYSCHSTSNCQSCHDHAPATHTAGFLHPSSNDIESNRHILLARLRSSSCLVCHDSFVTTCGECHAPDELHRWQQQGLTDLEHWPKLMNHPRKSKPAPSLAPKQHPDEDSTREELH